MSPLVTVLITTHNYGHYISRCLRSLLSQKIDRSLYEIIVVDDASTDNTYQIIENFKNQILYIKNKKQLGLPGSLNVGIKKI